MIDESKKFQFSGAGEFVDGDVTGIPRTSMT